MVRIKPIAVAAAMLLVVAVAAVGFAGCKKKTAPSAQKGRNFGNFNPQDMEQQYKNGLNELVQAGTITQDQADKIYTVLTERFSSMASGASRFSGSRPSGNGSGGNWSSGSRPSFSGSGSWSGGSGASGGGMRGGQSNMLSSLVSDGTITQAQADAVMQKLMGSVGGRGNPSSGQ